MRKAKTYFNNPETIEELKEKYRKLVKMLHPDNGGDENEFKAMQSEFTKLYKALKNIHRAVNGEHYEKDNGSKETAEQFMDIIEKIIHMDGCVIEIMGSWVWVSGDTKKYADILKEIGFWWSSAKKAWYYTGGVHQKRRGSYSLNQLRKKWGAVEVETEKQEAIG